MRVITKNTKVIKKINNKRFDQIRPTGTGSHISIGKKTVYFVIVRIMNFVNIRQ